MTQRAKVFMNGRSQAVRLPAMFRFDSDEAFIRRDPESDDVVLSARPTPWDGFLELLERVDVPKDFLDPAERSEPPPDRDPFDGWSE
jgi:antitoxin VapB